MPYCLVSETSETWISELTIKFMDFIVDAELHAINSIRNAVSK
jgi:hypothetical protein